MAADAPFGSSFGDPRRYMGQSPLAEIGKAAKTGLVLYGLQQSGAIQALDKLGVKPNQAGTFSYNNPAAPTGSVPPTNATTQPVMPNVAGPNAVNPNAVAPTAPAPITLTPPANIGFDVLDGKYNGAEISEVNPQAQRDSLILPQQTGYNTMLATGNEYQQMPGYGKLAKAMQGMAGGMMG
jgi:hypothetical protein